MEGAGSLQYATSAEQQLREKALILGSLQEGVLEQICCTGSCHGILVQALGNKVVHGLHCMLDSYHRSADSLLLRAPATLQAGAA